MDIRRPAILVVALGLFAGAQAELPSSVGGDPIAEREAASGVHDFDFLVGRWRVHHRKLQTRLANKNDWIEFDGTLAAQKLMDGYANVDDNTFAVAGGAYRGVALRSFNAKSRTWSIWWLDSRTPLGPMDPPVRGRFQQGVGTFYGDDVFDGRPIRVRYIWSKIAARTAHWEQAFSVDGGATWETNWLMDFERVQ